MTTANSGASGASWFWPNVLLAALLIVGLLTVAWCVWQAVQTW